MDLHVLYNYDQIKKASTKAALEMLIPAAPNGGNAQCAMFWARGRGGSDGQPEPLPVPFTIVRAA